MIEPLLQADPGNPRLWAMKGIALRGLNRTEESLSAFENALRISPKMLPALEGAAEVAYTLHDPKSASFVSRVLDLDPHNEIAHAMAGAIAFEWHDCKTVVSHFAASGHALDRNAPALLQYGACLVEERQPEQATNAFQRLLAVQPNNKTARYDLALSHHLAGHNIAALEILRPLANSPDTGPDVLSLLASVYDATGALESAIAALRRAAELAPHDERSYLDLAALCMDHQSHQLALDVLDTGIKNNPGSARLHTAQGAILAQLGKPEQAEAEFETANRLQPDQIYGSLGLSTLYRELQKSEDAIALLRGKLRAAPHDYRLYYLLADTLLHQDGLTEAGLAEARTALMRSVQSKPDFAKAHSVLGKLYLRTGESDKAVAEFRIAIQLDPSDRIAMNQLLLALQRQGLNDEAQRLATVLRAQIDADRNAEIQRNRVRLK